MKILQKSGNLLQKSKSVLKKQKCCDKLNLNNRSLFCLKYNKKRNASQGLAWRSERHCVDGGCFGQNLL